MTREPIPGLDGWDASATGSEHGLRFYIDSIIPEQTVVGRGLPLMVYGWCYHPESRIKRLELFVNDCAQVVKTRGMPRRDVWEQHAVEHSLNSGFWELIDLPGTKDASRASISLKATLENGVVCRATIANVDLTACMNAPDKSLEWPPTEVQEPRVAICLATYDPDMELFARQIDSLIQQTHKNWIAIVIDDCSDPHVFERIRQIVATDQRFYVFRNRSNLGFYRNFERCLSLVPTDADFVSLADQDDYWHPDKLASLMAGFRPTTTLVYSDMRIVSADGRLIADTYWTTRRNNYKDLACLLMANTITGSAFMIRRELLSHILPFPQKFRGSYHDHWIASVALSLGSIEYVGRPLYDYVQHERNVIGHITGRVSAGPIPWTEMVPILWGRRKTGDESRRALMVQRRHAYLEHVLRVKSLARAIELRCGLELDDRKRRALERMVTIDSKVRGRWWLALRSLRGIGDPDITLGMERVLLAGVLWKRMAPREESYAGVEVADEWPSRPSAEDHQVAAVAHKVSPLRLTISSVAPRRVNLMIPCIDLEHFFGTYITLFSLARQLALDGLDVRILTVDPSDELTLEAKRQVQAFAGLEDVLDHVTVVDMYDRSQSVEVNPKDTFIASTWWTAQIAHQAMLEVGGGRFLYLIQEYEPCVYPTGTWHALARETYDFPHYAVFSTEILRDYFRQHALGVFSNGPEAGERHSMSFQNPITHAGPVDARDLASRDVKRLLFYARPEEHASRNMFELGILAISRLIALGQFGDEWEFYGVGKIGAMSTVGLANGVRMKLLPRESQEAYLGLLRACDLGVSLMHTPHPSLVPIEMASAGMMVVTNSFSTKNKYDLAAISSNIVAVEPTLSGLRQGLRSALLRMNDFQARATGSNVKWSRNGQDSFDGSALARMRHFIEEPAANLQH